MKGKDLIEMGLRVSSVEWPESSGFCVDSAGVLRESKLGEQPGLFDVESLPHQSHSATSKAAAELALPNAGTQRAAVLRAIDANEGGLTDEQIQTLLAMNPSTERPRRIELVQGRLVVDSGVTRKTVSGRNAVVWIRRKEAA